MPNGSINYNNSRVQLLYGKVSEVRLKQEWSNFKQFLIFLALKKFCFFPRPFTFWSYLIGQKSYFQVFYSLLLVLGHLLTPRLGGKPACQRILYDLRCRGKKLCTELGWSIHGGQQKKENPLLRTSPPCPYPSSPLPFSLCLSLGLSRRSDSVRA